MSAAGSAVEQVVIAGPIRIPGSHRKHPRWLIPCEGCGTAFEAVSREAHSCPECRYIGRTGRSKRPKYPLTDFAEKILREQYDSGIRGRVTSLARTLGWPPWKVKKTAATMGLGRSRKSWRRWDPLEDQLLEREASRRTVPWLAKRLNRSEVAVAMRLKHLRLSRREHDGWFTATELAGCMGVDAKTVTRWIEKGWLVARHRGTNSPMDPWMIEEAAIRKFVRSHPMAFDLRRVDQLWFVDMVFGGAVQA